MSGTKWKLVVAAAAALLGGSAGASLPPEALKLWRLDCGSVEVADLGSFSDTGLYAGQRKTLAASCYLIRHGSRYLLWDTGVSASLAGKARDKYGNGLTVTIASQLARIGVRPADIEFVGISHVHLDHTGQVGQFPGATLLIGKADWTIVQEWPMARSIFANWIERPGKKQLLEQDFDVFGDGTVTILRMPGHTPGHQALLVRLASGPVLLSGDQYHFAENRAVGGVPGFNSDRADTLASHDRFERLAENLKAKVIIQHEPGDIAKLPPFPGAAE